MKLNSTISDWIKNKNVFVDIDKTSNINLCSKKSNIIFAFLKNICNTPLNEKLEE